MTKKYSFIFYEGRPGSTVAQEVALDFSAMADIEIRQANSSIVALLGFANQSSLHVANRDQRTIEHLPLNGTQRSDVRITIIEFLKAKAYQFPEAELGVPFEDLIVESQLEQSSEEGNFWEKSGLLEGDIEIEDENEDIMRHATTIEKRRWPNATIPFQLDDSYCKFQ